MDERTLSTNPQPELMDFDDKLALFLDKDTLQMTVDHCVQKGISLPEVRRFTEPEFRLQLAKLMLAGQYRIAPPHIILIPKPDSAEMRKVYCNNPMDRVICTQLGSVYTRMYQDRIHPCCVSYQKGVGVPHIVRRISDYIAAHPGLKGAKFDIHHYFDEISCEALDQGLRELDSGSCIDRIVWDYLHDDVILDEHGQVQRVYKGIAQGFAVSPFLANYLLRDIDEAIAKLDVVYYRYSDDILLLGPDFEKAKAILYEGLAAKGLHITPRKVTPIDADTRFTFLGFDICGSNITFSKSSLDRVKKEIRRMTKTRKGQEKRSEEVLRRIIRQINHKLYVAHLQNDREFGWGEYFLGTVTVEEDVRMLDEFIKDHIRHVFTGKWNSCSNYHKVPNDIVVEIFTRYADGETIREIISSLNERGIRTTRGKPFRQNSLDGLLCNRTYLGYYKYRGEEIENGVPAIITQELFDRVQARRARNRQSRAGAKAETEYLLTTKLYCGHCNSMMVGESGRSKNGSMYHYYKCGNHKRADGCHQRIFRKDVIEKLVIDRAIQLIHEDNVIDFVAECASRIQKQESTMLPVLEAQLREVQASIDNMIKAIEMGIITASTKERLEALEDDKKKLLSAIATEKMEHPDIPKEFFEYWLSRLVSGDIESPEYRKMIADIFINSIYVLDDGLKLGLNFSDGVDTIPLHQWNDAQCSDSLGYAPP